MHLMQISCFLFIHMMLLSFSRSVAQPCMPEFSTPALKSLQPLPPKSAPNANSSDPLPPIPSGSLVGADAEADRLMVHDSPAFPDPGRPMFGAEGDPQLAETPPAAAAVPVPVGVCEEQRPPTSSAFRPATQGSGRDGQAVLRLSTPQSRTGSASWHPQEATVQH